METLKKDEEARAALTTTIIGPEMSNQNQEITLKKKSDKDDPAFLKPMEIKSDAHKNDKMMTDSNLSQ